MIFWSIVFLLISLVLMLGNFFNFPPSMYQYFPLTTLLGSLGLLYRTLYKMRKAEKENYRLKINKLKSELDEYKKRIIDGEADTYSD